MTDTKQVMQQALDALCLPCDRWNGEQTKIINAAIEALRGCLTAPAAEPEQSTRLRGGVPSVEAAHEMGANGGPVVEDERLAFEAWMRGHCWSVSPTWNGREYEDSAEDKKRKLLDPLARMTRMLWAAWRDRAALTAAPQAPELDAVKWNALTETALDSFLEDYEMCGEDEDGCDAVHTPTEGERALIKDAVMGFLVEAEAAAMSAQGGAA